MARNFVVIVLLFCSMSVHAQNALNIKGSGDAAGNRKIAASLPVDTTSVVTFSGSAPAPAHKLALWYRKPAVDWATEALPIGNGFIGGMVFGGIVQEDIQYNEKSLWVGGPSAGRPGYQGGNVDNACTYLAQARTMLRSGDKAGTMTFMNAHCAGNGDGFGNYQNFGDIYIKFLNLPNPCAVTNYRREVDMEEGVARVSYQVNGATYGREYFCSYPDKALVMRLTCNQPGKLNVEVSTTAAHQATITATGNTISVRGIIGDNGMIFESKMKVMSDGGTVTAGSPKVTVTGANALTIVMTAGTNYANVYPAYRGVDPQAAVTNNLAAASAKTYSALLLAHQADYKALFKRVSLSLNNDVASPVPTNELRATFRTNKSNPLLEILAFQWGRYLLIASSRDGALPANLQGIWNNSNNPPWCSDYHFDYNVQMNYCGAEVANLHECMLPYVNFVYTLITPGRVTAQKHFGVTNGGWILNTMVNPFGFTAPGWDMSWGFQPEAGPWGAQYAWDAYTFTGDTNLLRQMIYPIVKGGADFWRGWMIRDSDNTYISYPSISLEEGPLGSPMIDNQLAWEVVNNTLEAAKKLNVDQSSAAQRAKFRDSICPPIVGSFGQLQEWKEELDRQGAYGFGMLPQVVPVYAGRRISLEKTPVWANAAIKTMTLADQNFTTNGCAWGNFNRGPAWARFYNGEFAAKHLGNMIGELVLDNLFSNSAGAMQLDGTFAVTGMLAEMLIQSHLDNVRLLPALPKAWPTGSFTGLCARGGFVVGATWASSELTCADILSKNGDTLKLDYKTAHLTVPTIAGATYRICNSGGVLTLAPVGAQSKPSTGAYARAMKMFPNPARTSFTVYLDQPAGTGGATVTLADMRGRTIMATMIAKGQSAAIIDPSGLKNGLYLVKCMGKTEKIIISHSR